MPTTEEIETLRGLVTSLSAPHEDHCGSQCYGGRTDCCSRCAVLEGLVLAVREINHAARPTIVLPEWCASVRMVHVMAKPGEKHRHKYCQTCWHRQPQPGDGPLMPFEVEMKERFDAEMLAVADFSNHPFLKLLKRDGKS